MPISPTRRRPSRRKPLAGLIAWALACLLCSNSPAQTPEASLDAPPEVDVALLIEQLGHSSYAARVRAREALERLGLQAFDDLHAAQFHPDSEIAMTARYLVSSLLVSWSTESDPVAVREALDEYGAQSESERQNRMDRLAELPGRQGLAALVRLARFETSLKLSREAALAVMRSPMNEDPSVRRAEAETILEVLGTNQRQAAQWLRVYADDLLQGDYAAREWRRLISQQRGAVDEGNDANATRPAVMELVRVCATRAVAAGQRDQALQLVGEHLDLIPPRSREVIDACSWAIDNEMHPLVLQLHERYPDLFARQPILLYGAAEAKLVTDDPSDGAERLAAQAAAIDPLPPPDSPDAAKLSPKAIEERAERHRETGRELRSRGLFHWAEREYRHIIDSLPVDVPIAAKVRADLADMLGELLRYRDVVEILEPLVQRAEEDQQYARRLQTQLVNVSRLKSTLLHYQGLLKSRSGDADDLLEAQQLLITALELHPINVDILIDMYRLEGDERWRADVRRRIRSIASTLDNQIEAIKLQTQHRARFPDMLGALAEFYNQYAWLVSNTEGDQRKALQYSLRSLEILPDNFAQLDTAGRCYFALGDIENALRVQRRAVKLEPHSPPLLRQLAEFEAAASTQQGVQAEGPKAEPTDTDD